MAEGHGHPLVIIRVWRRVFDDYAFPCIIAMVIKKSNDEIDFTLHVNSNKNIPTWRTRLVFWTIVISIPIFL